MKAIKENWLWITAIIIIVVILFIIFGRGEKKPKEKAANSDTTAEPCTPSADGVVEINISGDSLVRMYQEISRLQAALKACTEGKKPATQKSYKSYTPAASNQTRSSSSASANENQTQKRNSSSAPADRSSQSSNPMIATNQYVGDVIGDGGCSFDENSKLFFYVKTSLLNSIKDRGQNWSSLNSESGPKGEEVGEYTYYRTPILILNDMLDKDWAWTAYVGNNSQYGYDMWLWHELVKLNANLKNDHQIQDNGLGGYQFVSKINYHSK